MSKYGPLSKNLLKAIGDATGFFSWPLPYTESWRMEQVYGSNKKIYDTLWQMEKRGWVKRAEQNGKKFFKLTSEGELQNLFGKAFVQKELGKWDGKWRLVIFDIPESSRDKRSQVRNLLKQNNFKKL